MCVELLASPLFPQRGLDLRHPDQGAQVFHLRADLRHVQAAHVVDVLTQPSRLTKRGTREISHSGWKQSMRIDINFLVLLDETPGWGVGVVQLLKR